VCASKSLTLSQAIAGMLFYKRAAGKSPQYHRQLSFLGGFGTLCAPGATLVYDLRALFTNGLAALWHGAWRRRRLDGPKATIGRGRQSGLLARRLRRGCYERNSLDSLAGDHGDRVQSDTV